MLRSLTLVAGVFLVTALIMWGRNGGSTADSAAAHASSNVPPKINSATSQGPKVVPVANVHQFGVINPGERLSHKFTVRNDGDSPLSLKLGDTTCKCTLANLEKAEVPAGGQTEIELQWHAEEPQFRFRQAAVVETNDPNIPKFELAVEGSVRVKLGTVPESIIFAEVPRDDVRQVELAVFSQAYTSVRLEKLESTLSNVGGEISGFEHDNLQVEHARWVRDMTVVRRPDDRSGSFEGKLRIHYVGRTPDGVEEAGMHEVPVYGETVGDVTLHGRNVVGKVLMLGQVSRLSGKSTRAYVHVRNAPADLQVEFLEAEPKFLRVVIGKPERLTPTMTRIPVDVAVPPGTDPVNYSREDALANVGLETSHADYPKIWLQTSFVVEP
ncbi:MAG: DUF1573 domain-containing protein [Pirellulales bacterium]